MTGIVVLGNEEVVGVVVLLVVVILVVFVVTAEASLVEMLETAALVVVVVEDDDTAAAVLEIVVEVAKILDAEAVVGVVSFLVVDVLDNPVEKVVVSYVSLFEKADESEDFLARNKYLNVYHSFPAKLLNELQFYNSYNKVENDKESAIIGVDLMKQILVDDKTRWIESKAVSTKINGFNKLNTFINNKYTHELEQAQPQLFKGSNKFSLDKKCNSMIGYCVEYYSKYLVYGKSYLQKFIEQTQKEAGTEEVNDCIIIRACMKKYKELMVRSFGTNVSKVIPGITIQQLVQEKYSYFVGLIVELGTRTADYVRKTLYADRPAKNDTDPDLSIRHISGLADYITPDTILDVKVRNYIDESSVRQVLAYHYLSTKRSDLDIKKVIVYDAVSDRAVIINIEQP